MGILDVPGEPVGLSAATRAGLPAVNVTPVLRRQTANDVLSALYGRAAPADDVPTVVWSAGLTSSFATPVITKPAILGTGAAVVSWNSVSGTPDPNFYFDPGVFSTGNGALQDLEMHGDLKPGGAAQAAKWNLAVEFITSDTDAFEVGVYDSTETNFLLEVNGTPVGNYKVPIGLANGKKATVTFPRNGTRRIRLSGMGSFTGVFLKTGQSISKPTLTRTIGAIVGDSYVNGAGAPYSPERGANQVHTYAPRLLKAMGSTSNLLAGIGGTGFIAGSTTNNYLTRASTVASFNPAFMIVTGSINDPQNGVGVQAAVQAFLDATVTIPARYVLTVLRPGWEACNAAIRAGVAAHGNNVKVISVDGIIDGTGNTQAGGTGMRGLFLMADNAHPSYEGHDFILRQTLEAYFDTARPAV